MTTKAPATFKELSFGQHPAWPDGVQAIVRYPNGYGVSVIRARKSYGGEAGLFEVAVLSEHSQGKWRIDYGTPITNYVIGYCTPRKVTSIMKRVAALEPKL